MAARRLHLQPQVRRMGRVALLGTNLVSLVTKDEVPEIRSPNADICQQWNFASLFCLLSGVTSLPVVAVDRDAVPLSPAQSCFWLSLSWNTVLSTHSHHVHKAPSPCGKSAQLTCQPGTELLGSGPDLQPAPHGKHGKATLPDVRTAMSSV